MSLPLFALLIILVFVRLVACCRFDFRVVSSLLFFLDKSTSASILSSPSRQVPYFEPSHLEFFNQARGDIWED